MKIASTSDWHYNPGDRFPISYHLPEEVQRADIIVLVGDMLNFLPLGIKAWRDDMGRITIASLHDMLAHHEAIYVFGNHEGKFSYLKEAVEGTHIKAVRDYTIYKKEGLNDVCIHGHQLTPDWGILAPIADDFVELAVKYFPQQWYNFCVKQNWLPSHYGNPVSYKLLLLYWFRWCMEAAKDNCNYIIGHSHHKAHIVTPEKEMPDVIDLGTGEWHLIETR